MRWELRAPTPPTQPQQGLEHTYLGEVNTQKRVCVCVSLRGYAFAYCAALKVCTFKYICLDASYGKQSHFSK